MAAPCSDPADADAEQADLGRLAIELAARGYHARLVTRGGRTWLHVINPQADVLAEQIHTDGDFFLWSWQQPVARRDQIIAAAERVSRVLRARNQGSTRA